MWSRASLKNFRNNVVALDTKRVSLSAAVLLSLLDDLDEALLQLQKPIQVKDDE